MNQIKQVTKVQDLDLYIQAADGARQKAQKLLNATHLPDGGYHIESLDALVVALQRIHSLERSAAVTSAKVRINGNDTADGNLKFDRRLGEFQTETHLLGVNIEISMQFGRLPEADYWLIKLSSSDQSALRLAVKHLEALAAKYQTTHNR